MSKIFFTSHFSLLISFFLLCAHGQEDARSQKIIDEMVAKFKTYPSVSISFSATVTQWQDKPEQEQEGKLWLKGNKYKLELPDFVIYFDGSKIYHHHLKAKEVNIAKPNPDENNEDFQLMNPQSWFNLTSKNFKSTLIKESIQNGRRVSEIDLYPIQVKTTQYSRIRVMVEKSTLQIVYLHVFMNNGSQFAISLKPYDIQQTALRDTFFTFNRLEHPGVEVIDLTF